MRDILFKAKRIDNGEWVQGGILHQTDYYGDKVDKYFIIDGTCTVDYDIGEAFEVDENTVCQYTGLTDKNGNKIWENDIVELYDTNNNYKWKAIVKFGNPNATYNWGYQLHPIGQYKVNTDILLWVEMEDTGTICEVIGNVFDNPELLNYVDNEESQQAHQEVLKPAT